MSAGHPGSSVGAALALLLSIGGVGCPLESAEKPIELSFPLPADRPATASFGEYRRGHLHAGLDFSTGGELGWPVRAAAAGEVFRLKVEKRGYGRAVYIRHPGGFVTVYGHLHRFSGPLEAKAQEVMQARRTRYPGNIDLEKPVPVESGDEIGLSGETGGGPAHLHFELRRGDEPVDPTRYGGLRPRGFAAPVLEELWVLPRGATRIDHNWHGENYSFVREGTAYRLVGIPEVEGEFELALTAHVPGVGTLGLARLDLSCGERRVFHADLHRFSFDQYRQSGLIYDPSRSGSGPTRYTYRLRAAAGMDLPGVEGAWLQEFEAGPLECRIEASDALGNATIGEFTLALGSSPGYAARLPERVESHAIYPGLMVLNGEIPLDPRALPSGASRLEGMPQVAAPGTQELAVIPRPGLEIRFAAGATYGTTDVTLDPAPEAVLPGGDLQVVIPPVALGPPDLFLRKAAQWGAQVPDPRRTALYRYDPKDREWRVMGKEILEDREIRQGVRGGGIYAFLRDRSAPAILAVQLRDEERLGVRRIVFPTREVGEGIDVEAFEVAIDGKIVPAEYDPDRGWGQVWLRDSLRGPHAIDAACQDRAGNRSARFQATVEF